MKKAIILSVALIAIMCISVSIIGVEALNSNEWSSSYVLSSSTYYQGDSGTVTVTFTSNCPDQLTLSSLSIQFDWSTTPVMETVSSPNIATGNQYTFPAISFSIPSDATVGSHSFTLSMTGQQKELFGWTNISPNAAGGSINILDAYEKVYNNLAPTVQNSLANAQNSNNLNSQAQSLLQQAQSMYNQAATLSSQGQWQNAVNDLNTANSDLSQAEAQPTATPSAPEFPAIAVLAIFLALSLFAVTLLAIRKQKIGNG